MSHSWLRLWHDMPNDPKWRTIARISKQQVSMVQSVYLQLLVSASESEPRGFYSIAVEDIASALDSDDESITLILNAMQGRVLDGNKLSGWEQRQPEKDESGVYRSKAKNNYIYYVVATNSDVVRVGVNSNPWARLKEINSYSSEKFELFATMRITTRSSEPFTTHLKKSHKEGEWFYRTEALNLLMEKTKNKELKSEQEYIDFLNSLPVEAFDLLRSNPVVAVATTYKDTEEDQDTDPELKDPPLNSPKGKSGKNKFDPLSVELPEWLSPELWAEWVGYRKQLGKPIKTQQGVSGSINKLAAYRAQGYSPEFVVNLTMENEWRGLLVPEGTVSRKRRDVNEISQPDNTIPDGFRG